jgi:hypothetical protein
MPATSIEDIRNLAAKPLRLVKLVFTPIALIFLLTAGWHSRDILAVVFHQASAGYLVLAIVAWLFSHLLSPLLSYILFSEKNPTITYSLTLVTHVGRLPARYLPGGIWHTVARIADFHSFGIKPKQLTAFFILENTIALGVTFAVGGALVGWYQTGAWHTIALVASAGALLGLAVCPFILNRWILDKHSALSIGAYLKVVLSALLFWALASTAFFSYLLAFPGSTQTNSMLEITGTYLFSWAVGYIALFAPQGLGVFEAVAGDILQTTLSLGAIAVLVAGFRLVILIADLVAWSMLLAGRLLWPGSFLQPTNSDVRRDQP